MERANDPRSILVLRDLYGMYMPGGLSWQKTSPAASATAEILALIGRPVKYFGRITTESRFGICAASVRFAKCGGRRRRIEKSA